jgi:sodium transport system permease protein
MYPAIDLGVGEKERGTLETLLLTPISRFKIVLAKFLVIFTTSFLAVLLSMLSFSFILSLFIYNSLFFEMISSQNIQALTEWVNAFSTISMMDVGLMGLMLIPIAAIFSSLLLSVSIYARTFKEAQNYMSPLMMVSIFPLILALLPGIELDWFWSLIPLTNVALAIKEIFKGSIDYNMLWMIFGSSLLLASIGLFTCSRWFQRESVLFRS